MSRAINISSHPSRRHTIQDDLRNARVADLVEAWTERHGLEVFGVECRECGAEQRTTIPFRMGRTVGLVAPPCVCGNRFGPFEVRSPRDALDLSDLVATKPETRWKRRPKVVPLRRST